MSLPTNRWFWAFRIICWSRAEVASQKKTLEVSARKVSPCGTRTFGDTTDKGCALHAIRVQLTDLETQHQELTEKLAALEPRAVRLQLRNTRRFVESRLRNLQSMLTGEPRLVRAEIAKHVEKIILTPEGRTYVASGTWDLLGSEAVTMVPGARIELATPAFSGRRSTSELPRHA